MSSLTHLMFSLLLLKIPSLIEAKHSLKKLVLILAVTSSLTWLPLIFVLLFLGQTNPLWFMALWILSMVPTILIAPLRDNWLAGLIPMGSMGRYLSLRSTISAAAYLGTFLLMGYMLDLSRVNISRGFAAVFFVAFLASLASIIFYRPIHAPPVISDKQKDFNFLDFLKETRRGHLGTFIMYVSMVNFTVYLCSPLFAIYMLNDLHFSYLTFTALICIEYLARVLSLTLWGKHTDRASALKILGIVSYFIPVVPVLWLFSSNIVYLAMVQVISGAAWAIFELCTQTFIYRASPQTFRLKYVIYHKSLSTLFVSLGALAGAYLINIMFPVFGSKILGLFLVSGVLRLLVVRYMLPKLRDITLPVNPHPATPDLDAFFETWVPKYSLFNYAQDWPLFQPVPITVASDKTLNKQALLYQPKEWIEFQPVPAKEEVADTGKVLNKQALLYQPEAWTNFETAPVQGEVAATGKTINKQALLYQPKEWIEFQPVLAKEEVAATGKALNKQALLYQPEAWIQFQPAQVQDEVAGTKHTLNKQALLYQPEAWTQFQPKPATEEVMASKKTINKQALLHQPDEWTKLQPAPVQNDVIATRKAINKQALLYQPEAWKEAEPVPAAKVVTTRAAERIKLLKHKLSKVNENQNSAGKPPSVSRGIYPRMKLEPIPVLS
jgi:MFS family permease